MQQNLQLPAPGGRGTILLPRRTLPTFGGQTTGAPRAAPTTQVTPVLKLSNNVPNAQAQAPAAAPVAPELDLHIPFVPRATILVSEG